VNPNGLVISVLGVLVFTQVVFGDALHRLKILPTKAAQ